MKGDPRLITARRGDTCGGCKRTIKAGEQVFYYPRTGKVFCDEDGCGGAASRDFDACAFDEAMVSGW